MLGAQVSRQEYGQGACRLLNWLPTFYVSFQQLSRALRRLSSHGPDMLPSTLAPSQGKNRVISQAGHTHHVSPMPCSVPFGRQCPQ